MYICIKHYCNNESILFIKNVKTNANNTNNNSFYHLLYCCFSKYDIDIQTDDETWYSVTSDEIDHHILTVIIFQHNDRRFVMLVITPYH